MASKTEEKTATITINGRDREVAAKELSFREVVSLAYDGNPPTGPNWVFTVTYRKGEDKKPEGTMVDGDRVKVKDGMIFNVRATDNS